jgi:hypothetical protein
MQPYPYAPYPYPNPNGAAIPVRYMVPTGYRQNSPPFANQSFDRYATVRAPVRPPPSMAPRYPPGYAPGYPPRGMPMPPVSTMMPVGSPTRPQQQRNSVEQLQPPQPYYYNPYGPNGATPAPPPPPVPKPGAKEYKDKAFTIAPDGARSEAIKGLVSNNDINDLLKHKGTKVKVSKIYRISKTKPEIKLDSSSDDDLPPLIESPKQQQPPPAPPPQQQQQPIQRPISSSSSGSHCSTCSNCSCSDCRGRRRSHTYDDCPECRAEWKREQARRQRRK